MYVKPPPQSTMFPRGDNLQCHPVKNVIFILIYRMSHFYNKFHCCEIFPRDIQNCHPAHWPIILLEINMRYNKLNDHTPYVLIQKFVYTFKRVNSVNRMDKMLGIVLISNSYPQLLWSKSGLLQSFDLSSITSGPTKPIRCYLIIQNRFMWLWG